MGVVDDDASKFDSGTWKEVRRGDCWCLLLTRLCLHDTSQHVSVN